MKHRENLWRISLELSERICCEFSLEREEDDFEIEDERDVIFDFLRICWEERISESCEAKDTIFVFDELKESFRFLIIVREDKKELKVWWSSCESWKTFLNSRAIVRSVRISSDRSMRDLSILKLKKSRFVNALETWFSMTTRFVLERSRLRWDEKSTSKANCSFRRWFSISRSLTTLRCQSDWAMFAKVEEILLIVVEIISKASARM